MNQTDGNASQHTEMLGSFAGIHFEFENHSCPIVGRALDQPVAENDARRILEWLHKVIAIQREPMEVGTPIRVGMIVKKVSKIGF